MGARCWKRQTRRVNTVPRLTPALERHLNPISFNSTDIDSATATVAYAYMSFYESRDQPRIIPLIMMNSEHCRYWPELEYVFKNSGVSSPRHSVVWQNEFKGRASWPTSSFILMGRQTIPAQFSEMKCTIVGIVERHEVPDALQDQFKNLRPHLVSVGPACCSTNVALTFKLSPFWSPDVAWFLLCGICDTTQGLLPHHMLTFWIFKLGGSFWRKGDSWTNTWTLSISLLSNHGRRKLCNVSRL